jgi:hypothetical protein
MRFGRRDHEPYIGGYDPEHEMPDPSRHPRDRWQSEAYRHNARDSRFAYRWDPDRFEERQGPSRGNYRSDGHERIQPRDRYESAGRPDYDYDYGYDRPRYSYDRGDYGSDRRDYGSDRGAYSADRGSDRLSRDYDRVRDDGRDYNRDNRDHHRDHIRDHIHEYERGRHVFGETPNRENWSSGDFDQRWDYGRRDEERDLPSDRGYLHDRSYGAYGNMRDWDRRPDGERYPSDFGWGQSGRRWEHGRDFDDRGRWRKW